MYLQTIYMQQLRINGNCHILVTVASPDFMTVIYGKPKYTLLVNIEGNKGQLLTLILLNRFFINTAEKLFFANLKIKIIPFGHFGFLVHGTLIIISIFMSFGTDVGTKKISKAIKTIMAHYF